MSLYCVGSYAVGNVGWRVVVALGILATMLLSGGAVPIRCGSPSARCTSRYAPAQALADLVWQEIRASHPDNRFRLMLSLGRAF